ncbi:MAG: SET domain-containing protein-lysine N-methyltransferase [Spirochaetales bacterium]|nr:SET domain-containing protein-lysine N-methyltransferase [Spirochaetales bacterium]
MADNVIVKKSSIHGKGVFALRDFKEHEYVLTIDDAHVVEDESQLTPEQHEFEVDYLSDRIVFMQEPEKYINHSCDPNVYIKTEDGIRHVYAMKEIASGEEITFDYSINGDNDGTFECHCGSEICRGTYQGNFFKLPIELQKKYLPYLDTWFSKKYEQEIKEIKNK